MANTTTNYGLYKPEGTDPYNHLIYDNPNMDTIDAAMKANSDASVNRATCVKTGTNHAVIRSNTDANVFEFTATGDWMTGDTMTVDGVSVSVYLPDGSAPLDHSYVINSEVLAIIQGARVTLYTSNTVNAADVAYNNTLSGLTATDVQSAIDELNNDIDNINDSDTLINESVPVVDTWYEYTLNNGRAFSDYKNVSIFLRQYDNVLGNIIIPRSVFVSLFTTSSKRVSMFVPIFSDATLVHVEVYYVNDTKVMVKMSHSSPWSCYILGIK